MQIHRYDACMMLQAANGMIPTALSGAKNIDSWRCVCCAVASDPAVGRCEVQTVYQTILLLISDSPKLLPGFFINLQPSLDSSGWNASCYDSEIPPRLASHEMRRVNAFSANSSLRRSVSRTLHGTRRIFVSCTAGTFQSERCAMHTACLRVIWNWYSRCSILDVWSELAIVSQPDKHIGRRGSILSVCERARFLSSYFR